MKYAKRVFAWLLALCMTAAFCRAEGAPAETPEEIITSAMEVYSWFTICPLDVDPELPGEDGYYRVADDDLCREEAMMALLSGTFSEEIIASLMEYGVYAAEDGVLYDRGGGRAVDPSISEVEYEEISAEEKKTVYRVTVHYLGEGEREDAVPEEFEFVREFVDDQWVFTEFPFFW